MPESYLLEIACFNIASAGIAQKAGAHRIELCEGYNAGGTTPSQHTIREACSSMHIPVHVIIRPRGGNFVYSKNEIAEMKHSISFCKEQGAHGFVLGALTADDRIDTAACKELMAICGALPVTFHRAIDQCADPDLAMRQIIDLGFSKVLTSGFNKSAEEGADQLNHLRQSYGRHITVMPGGGVRSSNLEQLMRTGCREYHSAAITTASETADGQEIRKMLQILNSV